MRRFYTKTKRKVGLCVGCGEDIEEGEFCYWLTERYFCRDCVEKGAMIATARSMRFGRASGQGLSVRSVRQVGRYLERELDFGKREL